MKFKVGDKVFHVGYGVGQVHDIHQFAEDTLSTCVEFSNTRSRRLEWFTVDGMSHVDHIVPQLYTLAEARKMGFDVPKVKKSKTVWLYYGPTSGSTYVCEQRELTQVGFIEKEVTFEWEEEI